MASEEDKSKISQNLSATKIISLLEGYGIVVDRQSQRNKATLLSWLWEQPAHILSFLSSEAQAALDEAETARQGTQKRRNEQRRISRQAKRAKLDNAPLDGTSLDFPILGTEQDILRCHRAWNHATSNSALEQLVCVSCCRELHHSEGRHEFLDNLPHPELLVPKKPHPMHETIGSLLLLVDKVKEIEGRKRGWFCSQCLDSLARNRLPPLTLANGTWIGKIPAALLDLTIPEQILISIYQPRAYIYKLIRRNLWTLGEETEETAHLQPGLKGNVTTFEINMPHVVQMIEGKLMPRPMSLLASLIAVTFIGPGRVPKNWLKKTFQVRRNAVLKALRCLKYETKHPGYVDIEISDQALNALPDGEGAVPTEILAALRHEDDIEKAQAEAASYTTPDDSDTGNNNCPESHAPDAIPLQYLGATDVDLSKVSPEEIMTYALANINGSQESEGGYAIRHSATAVNEFSRPNPRVDQQNPSVPVRNYSVYAFPWLYPYGEGGIEADREVTIGFEEHIRHNLHYYDRRFRTHPTWPFVFFSMLQKRQALTAARLQMRRKDFDTAAALFSTLKREDLAQAAQAEAAGRKVCNPKILMLRRLVHCGGAKVMGSDHSRASYRSEIWSTMLSLNPPSLWVTINPVDIHDPIVQVLAGENIDMDRFLRTAKPGAGKRAANVARDPFAAAKYFHFFINLILETLFGIKPEGKKIKTTTGVLGRLAAYYGVVEAQGRGSLHVHMLLWLENAPSSNSMHAMLQDKDFRRRVAEYVDANVRAHLDGMTEETIEATKKETDLAWSRPPDPNSSSYKDDFAVRERRLARAQQVHVCRDSTCRQWKWGQLVCKRHAPFPLSSETTVASDGTVLPKRTYGYINNWNPSLLVYGACNNDIKFISNGWEARAIIWYITAYQTKKQLRSYNWTALLAEALAYHFDGTDYIDNIRERNRLLVFRCLRILNRQMEQSGQQVMSYLLGYGDRFRSHQYTPLYWSSLSSEILRVWQTIKLSPQKTPPENADVDPQGPDSHKSSDEDGEKEEVILDTLPSGALIYKSQFTDYRYRGDLFKDMNYVDFITETWEDNYRATYKSTGSQSEPKRGAPPHERDSYRNEHPHSGSRQRVRRAPGHRVLLNIVGPYLPRGDRPETYEYYCASMLSLLKPWRELKDLLPDGSSWTSVFDSFMAQASLRQKNFISAAAYYYQCQDAAAVRPLNDHGVGISNCDPDNVPDGSLDESTGDIPSGLGVLDPAKSEVEMLAFLESLVGGREEVHGMEAVSIARGTNLFRSSLERSWSVQGLCADRPQSEDMQNVTSWCEALTKDAASRKIGGIDTAIQQPVPPTKGLVTPISQMSLPSVQHLETTTITNPIVQEILEAPEISRLKPDQLRAYEIFKAHYMALRTGKSPEQLLMQIQGEGGTGKSMIIHCITQLLLAFGEGHWLLKAAYTGIAASLVDGSTLHTLCRLGCLNKDSELTQSVLEEVRRIWKDVKYLVIDEVSMVSRECLAKIDKVLSAAKNDSRPFGGIHVILTGDFHQFPPVATFSNAPLYWENDLSIESKDTSLAVSGRSLYEKFKTVVLLKEQCRTTDKIWHQVLQHARTGSCTPEDISVIRSLLMASDTGGFGTASVNDPEWLNAVLVTPRHGVRVAWNKMASRRHCAKNRTQLFICPAYDTIHGQPITIKERYYAARMAAKAKAERKAKGVAASKGDRYAKRERGNLPDEVELAVGMDVMVTYNVETELDVANGARGVVQKIILDPREEVADGLTSENARETTLKYPPACVLVKLARTKAHKIPGLDEGVVPIVPMERTYRITLQNGKQKQVKRRQLPMTAAYAFTDYRSQGQTIRRVIVDIAPPPTGGLTPFNVYVALSRSAGRDTIRLLRGFDESLFTKVPCDRLLKEDARLEELDRQTEQRWKAGEVVWEYKDAESFIVVDR